MLIERKILAPGTIVNGFSIIRELGHGGMGIVYLAKQVNLERYVALKVLEESLTADQEFVNGFFREARSAAGLSHPNIVQAYDAGIANGNIYFFVMELIDGENLDVYISKNGAVELLKGLHIAYCIADALAYAWEHQHLCHGDIKPENIILKKNGDVKLADLGLARDYRKEAWRPGEIMATPAYAPPEIIRAESEKMSFRSDMYSFGATLYHIFAGVPPFPGDDPMQVCSMQLNNQPRPLIAVNPNIPSQLSMLVDDLMEKSPDHRPVSWSFVAEKINKIIYGLEHTREKVEKDVLREIRAQNQVRLKETLIAGLSLFVLFLAGLSVWLVKATSRKEIRMEQALPAEKTEVIQQTASRHVKTEALAKWNFLKTSIPSMNTEAARKELKKYIDEYPFDANEESVSYVEFLDRKIIFEQDVRTFRKTLGLIEKEMSDNRVIRSGRKQDLQTSIHRIDRLFDDSFRKLQERAKEFQIDPASIDEGKKGLCLSYRDKLQRQLADVLQKEKEQHMQMQAEQERKAREKVKRQSMQSACRSDFILLGREISGIQNYKNAVQTAERLDEWKKKYDSYIPPELAREANHLRSIIPDAFVPESELFHEFQAELAGKEIFPGYFFRDAAEKGITCDHKNNNGILVTRRISWNLIREKRKSLSYQVCMNNELLHCLNADQQIKLFKRLLPFRYEEELYSAILNRCNKIPESRKEELIHETKLFLSLHAAED